MGAREADMIQRLVGVTVGGLVTFAFLLAWDATDFMEPIPAYALAATIGAVGSLVWPALIGWWFLSRRRDRRRDDIQREVDRQIAERDRSNEG